MDKNKLKNALNELAEFIKKTVDERVQKYGYNRKGINTLVDSDLIKDMKVTSTEDSVVLTIAEYWMYVSTGWKFNNFESQKIGLFNALVNWALKKVTKNNKEAFSLASALWYSMIKGKKGVHRTIPPRPFMVFDKEGDLEKMIPELKAYIDKWFADLFDAIMNDIDNYFNK